MQYLAIIILSSPRSKDETKIELYFRYLDDLVEIARAKNLEFRTLDRALYVFDKQITASFNAILTSCQVGWGEGPVGYGAITGGMPHA